MALIRKVRGHEPVIGENTFLAETAVILGDVTIGRDCSIWYNAVLRGDVNRIVIGDRTNIQDGVVLHTIYDKAKHLRRRSSATTFRWATTPSSTARSSGTTA